MSKDTKAMEKLAKAMDNLANTLQHFQDPVLWQKTFSDAFQNPVITNIFPSLRQTPRIGAPVVESRIESIIVSLSDEERAKLANQVYDAIKPQLREFSQFVQESLKEMPAHRLKELAEKIEAGEKPEIKRRHGCIFITAGDIEIYLGL